jgi:hypothetical protein
MVWLCLTYLRGKRGFFTVLGHGDYYLPSRRLVEGETATGSLEAWKMKDLHKAKESTNS